jgi:hypothetical protein
MGHRITLSLSVDPDFAHRQPFAELQQAAFCIECPSRRFLAEVDVKTRCHGEGPPADRAKDGDIPSLRPQRPSSRAPKSSPRGEG